MNENTRIAVCCYAGDCHQVIQFLPEYLHHKCPIVVLSPEDSKADVRYPGVEQRFAGMRAYTGQISLDRQKLHLMELLKFPEEYFLIHDADSVCLSPEIPSYLYAAPNFVWSNLVMDQIPEHQNHFFPGWPHVAFQPPYFLSRKTIKAMLAVSNRPRVQASPMMPFIDFYMVQLTMEAGLGYRRFKDCVSCTTEPQSPLGIVHVSNHVREGAVFIHSVKRREVLDQLWKVRMEYLKSHP